MELNDRATVILTKCGANMLNELNVKRNEIISRLSVRLKTDYKKGDIYENTFWEILGDFSNCFTAGCDMPFINLQKVTW